MHFKYSVLLLSMLTVGIAGCGSDDKPNKAHVVTPPMVEEITPNSIELQKIGAYDAGVFGASAAEIPAYDAATKQLFVVNAQAGVVDVLDFQQPELPKFVRSLDAKIYLAHSEVNSVAVKDGIVALAVQAEDKTQNGIVVFFNAKDLSYISQASVGALPDMLTFTPDGKKVLVANEGEPNKAYENDPEGSVSIIDIQDIKNPKSTLVNFHAWDQRKQELLDTGVRIFGPDPSQYANITQGIQTTSVSQDLEPEYIAVSEDGKTAWVSLQENNAIAVLDVENASFSDIFPLGYKDHSLLENALDAGDRDCAVGIDSTGQSIASCEKDAGMINIKSWPGLYGMYMPDAITHYQVDGKSYLVTANEGDAREWLKDENTYFEGTDLNAGFAEEIRVKHLFKKSGFDLKGDYPAHLRKLYPNITGAQLDSAVFGVCKTTAVTEICADNLIKDSQLGRLTISWTQGFKKDSLTGQPILNADGKLVYDKLYAYGGRSFSIVDPVTKSIVWDSGSEFEHKIASLFPQQFNSNHESFKFDDRSDKKGPEPEGLAIGKMGKKTYAFVGLERASGIMVYDISKPSKAEFVQYFNQRDITQMDIKQQGDLGPEGLIFIAAKDSPNGKPLLAVGNEVSGTTAVYQIIVK